MGSVVSDRDDYGGLMGCGCGKKKAPAGDPARAAKQAERRAAHEAARRIIEAGGTGTVIQK